MHFHTRQCLIFFCSSLLILMYGFIPFVQLAHTACACCLQTLKPLQILYESITISFLQVKLGVACLIQVYFFAIYCLFYINVIFPYPYLYLQAVIRVPSLYDGLVHTLFFYIHIYTRYFICTIFKDLTWVLMSLFIHFISCSSLYL